MIKIFGRTFMWGSYKKNTVTGRQDYTPYFQISKFFICLPLIFGNLYITVN